MNIRNFICTGIFVVAAFTAAGRATAAQVLYDNSGFVTGQQSFVQSFDISAPGTLTVTLGNVAWPEQLASLNMLVSSSSGLMGPEMGSGTDTFHIMKAGMVYTQWFGLAQGPLDIGVYSMKVQFQPNVVPLPASLALLASGLMLLAWQRRQRRPHSCS